MEFIIMIIAMIGASFFLFVRSQKKVSKRIRSRLLNQEPIKDVLVDDLEWLKDRGKLGNDFNVEDIQYIATKFEQMQLHKSDMEMYDFISVYHDFLRLHTVVMSSSKGKIRKFIETLDTDIIKDKRGYYVYRPGNFSKDKTIGDTLKNISNEQKIAIIRSIISIQQFGGGDITKQDLKLLDVVFDTLGMSMNKLDSVSKKYPKDIDHAIKSLNALEKFHKEWFIVTMNSSAAVNQGKIALALQISNDIGINEDEYIDIIETSEKFIQQNGF